MSHVFASKMIFVLFSNEYCKQYGDFYAIAFMRCHLCVRKQQQCIHLLSSQNRVPRQEQVLQQHECVTLDSNVITSTRTATPVVYTAVVDRVLPTNTDVQNLTEI